MLVSNLDKILGLYNGTRLIIKRMKNYIIALTRNITIVSQNSNIGYKVIYQKYNFSKILL
jgi:hypothetical protein